MDHWRPEAELGILGRSLVAWGGAGLPEEEPGRGASRAMSPGIAVCQGQARACRAAGCAGWGSLRPPAWLFLLWLVAGRAHAAGYEVREPAGGKEAS